MAITTATVSYTNQYDDIFIGYEDGTILLAVCESMVRHESIHLSSLELNFVVTWSIKMNFPIRYLEYGQMMDVTEASGEFINLLYVLTRPKNQNPIRTVTLIRGFTFST